MSSNSTNIIPISMTADFFANRASKSLDRMNYPKALRYFKKALEMDPKNPLHFCNVAGVLGYMGKFNESNQMLYHVLQKIDENAVECHYYLACNYAYLDLLEESEEHALIYLRKDPQGRFIEDTTELLEYIARELDRPAEMETEPTVEEDELTRLHEKARSLMESGSFQQAEKILVQLAEQYPDFLAGKNNLSLCYYYKGEIEKSRKVIQQVLGQDPCNIHALCNLAILYYQNQEQENLKELLAQLCKIVPMQYDQAYKLGITLGVMGEHQAAYQLFRKMSVYAWYLDFHIYHYCAVAAYNTGRYKEAEKFWKLVQREDPDSPIAPYYLEQLHKGETQKEVPYYYHMPTNEKKAKRNQKPGAILQEEIEKDPFIRSSFLWALRFGDRETKLEVLQAFEWLGDQEVIEALQEFVASPEQEEDLKQMARFVLKTLGYQTNDGSIRWRKSWFQVLEKLQLDENGEMALKAREIWADFIQRSYPRVPVIRKPEAWAAALEYLVISQSERDITILTERYGVSAKTLRKHVDTILEAQSTKKGPK